MARRVRFWAFPLGWAIILGLSSGAPLLADDGQIVTINGAQFRETTSKQQRQVVELKPQTRTYQQTQYKPIQQNMTRTVMVPITEYVWELQAKSSWNPFAQTEYEYKYVPHTRYEQRTEQVPVTVMKAEVVEVRVTEQVPTSRLVDVEVKTHVALSPTVNPGSPGLNNSGSTSQVAATPWSQPAGRFSLDGQSAPPTAALSPLGGGSPSSSIGQRDTRNDWKR